MIPEQIKSQLLSLLSSKYNTNVQLLKIEQLSGGSINEAFKLETSAGLFFLKYNDADKYPQMFESEAKGLQLLKQTNELYIPETIADIRSFLSVKEAA